MRESYLVSLLCYTLAVSSVDLWLDFFILTFFVELLEVQVLHALLDSPAKNEVYNERDDDLLLELTVREWH